MMKTLYLILLLPFAAMAESVPPQVALYDELTAKITTDCTPSMNDTMQAMACMQTVAKNFEAKFALADAASPVTSVGQKKQVKEAKYRFVKFGIEFGKKIEIAAKTSKPWPAVMTDAQIRRHGFCKALTTLQTFSEECLTYTDVSEAKACITKISEHSLQTLVKYGSPPDPLSFRMETLCTRGADYVENNILAVYQRFNR